MTDQAILCKDTLTTSRQVENFWKKVKKTSPSECWLWVASKNPKGYGTFRVSGKIRPAHRIAWVFDYGTIQKGLTVDHLCNRRDCVNVSHMRLVDLTANKQALHSNKRMPRLSLLLETFPTLENVGICQVSSKELDCLFGVKRQRYPDKYFPALVEYTGDRFGWRIVKPCRRGNFLKEGLVQEPTVFELSFEKSLVDDINAWRARVWQ